MSTTHLDLKDFGHVKLFRRRGLKNIRISIDSTGEVRLSVPWYVPKAVGIKFLYSKKDWIEKHRVRKSSVWTDGQYLTSTHKLKIAYNSAENTKTIVQNEHLIVYLPDRYNEEKQKKILDRHVGNFIRSRAEEVLVPLLSKLADESGYEYKDVRVRKLKSRWGSCSHQKTITLNSSLIHLPQDLIEYVIYHELVHTKHLNHSKSFWNEVEVQIPDYKKLRKKLRNFHVAGIL